ncbi:MAG: PEGA domain-containing protein [Pyrinomonadaceae bacterium]
MQKEMREKMRKNRYNFLFVVGLMLTLGLTGVFANAADDPVKRPKNLGILSVKTTPQAFPVKVNGQVIGMSGVLTPAEFYLAPGTHRVEIEGPNGQTFSKELEIRRNAKNCICIKIVEQNISRPCPYDIRVDGPEKVLEGDLITFAAFNAVTASETPINYKWTVYPETVRITSGQGTPSITVDSAGMGNQTVRAELDVWDGIYDASCRQKISVPTEVERPKVPEAVRCDLFESRAFDDDKARFDNCVIELQNRPDSQLYIIVYQGTDKSSKTTNNADKLGKRTLDYLVKTRGVDPRRISIVNWGTRPKTMFEIWIIPPGAQPPVPQ